MKKRILISIIMILFIIPSTIFAFDSRIDQDITPTPPEGMDTMAGQILGIIKWAGYAIEIGMVLYIGIKYMMAAANEKANLKQSVINYLIGALIVFAVTTIFNATLQFFGKDGAGAPITATDSSGISINGTDGGAGGSGGPSGGGDKFSPVINEFQ